MDELELAYLRGRRDAAKAIRDYWLGKSLSKEQLKAFIDAECVAVGHTTNPKYWNNKEELFGVQ